MTKPKNIKITQLKLENTVHLSYNQANTKSSRHNVQRGKKIRYFLKDVSNFVLNLSEQIKTTNTHCLCTLFLTTHSILQFISKPLL